ncbi:hypothetical protein LC724_19530 [Blautia sp. RD014234]|nr:hypothetical protein [Blautia parvula]
MARRIKKSVCTSGRLLFGSTYADITVSKDTWIGTVNMKELVEKKKTLCLTTDEIMQNKSIYCKVRELSTHPQEDTWPLICMTLSAE